MCAYDDECFFYVCACVYINVCVFTYKDSSISIRGGKATQRVGPFERRVISKSVGNVIHIGYAAKSSTHTSNGIAISVVGKTSAAVVPRTPLFPARWLAVCVAFANSPYMRTKTVTVYDKFTVCNQHTCDLWIREVSSKHKYGRWTRLPPHSRTPFHPQIISAKHKPQVQFSFFDPEKNDTCFNKIVDISPYKKQFYTKRQAADLQCCELRDDASFVSQSSAVTLNSAESQWDVEILHTDSDVHPAMHRQTPTNLLNTHDTISNNQIENDAEINNTQTDDTHSEVVRNTHTGTLNYVPHTDTLKDSRHKYQSRHTLRSTSICNVKDNSMHKDLSENTSSDHKNNTYIQPYTLNNWLPYRNAQDVALTRSDISPDLLSNLMRTENNDVCSLWSYPFVISEIRRFHIRHPLPSTDKKTNSPSQNHSHAQQTHTQWRRRASDTFSLKQGDTNTQTHRHAQRRLSLPTSQSMQSNNEGMMSVHTQPSFKAHPQMPYDNFTIGSHTQGSLHTHTHTHTGNAMGPHINTNTHTHTRSPNTNTHTQAYSWMISEVEITHHDSAAYFIVLRPPPTSVADVMVRNLSDKYVAFVQDGVHRAHTQVLTPHTACPFAWSDPSGNHKLIVFVRTDRGRVVSLKCNTKKIKYAVRYKIGYWKYLVAFTAIYAGSRLVTFFCDNYTTSKKRTYKHNNEKLKDETYNIMSPPRDEKQITHTQPHTHIFGGDSSSYIKTNTHTHTRRDKEIMETQAFSEIPHFNRESTTGSQSRCTHTHCDTNKSTNRDKHTLSGIQNHIHTHTNPTDIIKKPRRRRLLKLHRVMRKFKTRRKLPQLRTQQLTFNSLRQRNDASSILHDTTHPQTRPYDTQANIIGKLVIFLKSMDYRLYCAGLGISLLDNTPSEVLYLSLDNILFCKKTQIHTHTRVQPHTSHYKLQLGALQIDNRLCVAHKPTIIRQSSDEDVSTRRYNRKLYTQNSTGTAYRSTHNAGAVGKKKRKRTKMMELANVWDRKDIYSEEEYQDDEFTKSYDNSNPFGEMYLGQSENSESKEQVIKYIICRLSPMTVNLEVDTFMILLRLLLVLLRHISARSKTNDINYITLLRQSQNVSGSIGFNELLGLPPIPAYSKGIKSTFYIDEIIMSQIRLKLTLRALRQRNIFAPDSDIIFLRNIHVYSGKFTDVTNLAVNFSELHHHSLYMTVDEYTQRFSQFYMHQGLRQAAKLFGSIDLIGNPANLVTAIYRGVHSLIRTPYEAFRTHRRADAVVEGLGRGVKKLCASVWVGMFESIERAAGSAFKTLESLRIVDGDRLLNMWPKNIRADRAAIEDPQNVLDGVWNGTVGGTQTVLAAFAGVVVFPVKGAEIGGKEFFKESFNATKSVIAGIPAGVLLFTQGVSAGLRVAFVKQKRFYARNERVFFGK